MRLCADTTSLPDAMEYLSVILAFMAEAVCGAREIPWEEKHLWGAQYVFEALVADMNEVRANIIRHPK